MQHRLVCRLTPEHGPGLVALVELGEDVFQTLGYPSRVLGVQDRLGHVVDGAEVREVKQRDLAVLLRLDAVSVEERTVSVGVNSLQTVTAYPVKGRRHSQIPRLSPTRCGRGHLDSTDGAGAARVRKGEEKAGRGEGKGEEKAGRTDSWARWSGLVSRTRTRPVRTCRHRSSCARSLSLPRRAEGRRVDFASSHFTLRTTSIRTNTLLRGTPTVYNDALTHGAAAAVKAAGARIEPGPSLRSRASSSRHEDIAGNSDHCWSPSVRKVSRQAIDLHRDARLHQR